MASQAIPVACSVVEGTTVRPALAAAAATALVDSAGGIIPAEAATASAAVAALSAAVVVISVAEVIPAEATRAAATIGANPLRS
jgi:hypothetical protein